MCHSTERTRIAMAGIRVKWWGARLRVLMAAGTAAMLLAGCAGSGRGDAFSGPYGGVSGAGFSQNAGH